MTTDQRRRAAAEMSAMTRAIIGQWEGEPRPRRYRIVSAPMNGEPGALAYVRGPDGRYHAVCLTVMSLDADGRVVELTTFVLPELLAAWGCPAVCDAWLERACLAGTTSTIVGGVTHRDPAGRDR
jgi:hypothetical protein